MKVIYNVTVNIDDAVCGEWIEWMKNVHIPEVLDTNLFLGHTFTKVITGEHSSGTTFSIQYICPSMEAYEKYRDRFAPALQAAHSLKYHGKFTAFRTLLEVQNESVCG